MPVLERPSSQNILKEVFGFDAFRPGQERAMAAVLSGRNVLCVMPTGSGKSLCFQVPALVLGGLTIVVSPLVALMQDQVAALKLAGVAADTINSSRSREDNVAAWRRAASGETRLLYLSPERLMTEPMLAALAKLPIGLIAVDEAHCISQWGPAFRPEYEALSRLASVFPRVPLMALTATADEATRADIAARLFGGRVEQIVLGFDRPNIRLTVAAKQDTKQQLLTFVKAHKGQSGIVYCLSRKKTETVAAFLAEAGIKALAYHAGMSKEAREANQNAFMTEPYTVMVATIAFGMGIDKSDVRYVFHADLPASLESYYQEIGRAGRDGAPAEAHMLFGRSDIVMRRKFIEDEAASEEHKKRGVLRLGALVDYCETARCRRHVLLAYFGEEAGAETEPCGNCDACLSPAAMVDGAEAARQILAVVRETGERFGATHIVDVLRGAETEKIIQYGHKDTPSYGCGHGRKKDEWRSLIRQLVASGHLIQDESYGGLALSGDGRTLLKGGTPYLVREHQRTRARERGDAGLAALSDGQDALLTTLKKLRLSLASRRQVPAFVIFSDKTLQEMARHAPRNMEAFAAISGVGTTKLRDFGKVFTDAIAAHLDSRIG